MILQTLASGSSGNAILVQSNHHAILIDAGISCRKITQRLQLCGLKPEDLDGILITHEHSDHIRGLPILLKYHPCTVYASNGTCRAIASRHPDLQRHLMAFPAGACFQLGGFNVTSFSTPHDATDSVGYLLSDGDKSVAILTDLGEIPAPIAALVTGADAALLESNHDVQMLQNGPYPYSLQRRILGRFGHLCNQTAAQFAVHLAQTGTETLLLAHLSKENNTPDLARSEVEQALHQHALTPTLAVAPRDALSEAYRL